MFNARDAMTTEICSVTEDTPVLDAMRILVEHNVTGLPVVDDEKRLRGIVSEKDMLKLLYEKHLRDEPVSSFMTAEPVSFQADDTLVDICECLIKENFRRVPILEEGKLVGIISRRDIIKYILRVRKGKSSES
ncbi:MAG: CBS domain-containing protein [bacterium]|nr:CBS domain-containing protein [bacterium]